MLTDVPMQQRAADPHCFHYEELEDSVEHTLFYYPYWEDGRREIVLCIGRRLRPEDVPYIILGPEQELLPDDISWRRRIVASAEKQRLAFGRLVETIFGQKEAAERVRQEAGER